MIILYRYRLGIINQVRNVGTSVIRILNFEIVLISMNVGPKAVRPWSWQLDCQSRPYGIYFTLIMVGTYT